MVFGSASGPLHWGGEHLSTAALFTAKTLRHCPHKPKAHEDEGPSTGPHVPSQRTACQDLALFGKTEEKPWKNAGTHLNCTWELLKRT